MYLIIFIYLIFAPIEEKSWLSQLTFNNIDHVGDPTKKKKGYNHTSIKERNTVWFRGCLSLGLSITFLGTLSIEDILWRTLSLLVQLFL